MNAPFHYSFFITDIEKTKIFYIDLLGCKEGRSTGRWIDLNFFGNQISCHLVEQMPSLSQNSIVDTIEVPMPHFGACIDRKSFDEIEERLRQNGIEFFIQPTTRFEGMKGEQKVMFFKDPNDNFIELKSYTDNDQIFTK